MKRHRARELPILKRLLDARCVSIVWREKKLLNLLVKFPGGKDEVCALVEVQGPQGTWRASLTSQQESKTAALCALPMIEALYEGQIDKPGVWLPEQVINPDVYQMALAKLGLSVQILPDGIIR